MSQRTKFYAELDAEGTLVPFQLSTGQPYTVVVPNRTLHIRLLDDQGAAMAGEAFKVEFDNGQAFEGTLDERGEARVKSPDGTGRLSFPSLKKSDAEG